jgi:hypothetical protein
MRFAEGADEAEGPRRSDDVDDLYKAATASRRDEAVKSGGVWGVVDALECGGDDRGAGAELVAARCVRVTRSESKSTKVAVLTGDRVRDLEVCST